MKNRMHLEIHNSTNMTTSEVLSVLDEVSTASSGREVNPESCDPAAALFECASELSELQTLQTPLGTPEEVCAPSPGCQKNNPPVRNKYSRTHLGQWEKSLVVFPLVLLLRLEFRHRVRQPQEIYTYKKWQIK